VREKKTMKCNIFKSNDIKREFGSPLPSGVLNIEDKSRSNLFAWRGQFSPQLIEALLAAYSEPYSQLLDPFMGSGTVLVEGAAHGCSAYGYEINPAALTIGKLYELCTMDLSKRNHLLKIVDNFLSNILTSDMPLFSSADITMSDQTKKIMLPDAVVSIHNRDVRRLVEALIVITDHDPASVPSTVYWKNWRELKKAILGLPYTKNIISANLGDARELPIKDKTIDYAISSPPYINVFNYHHNYRTAIESLGWMPLSVARSEIGSNRKFRQNRFYTVVQYSVDMALALKEINRVCKEKAKITLVVGRESNVQKTPFYNGDIVERIACEANGFRLVLKQERVFKNRFGQKIYEDILNLQPISQIPNKKETIIKIARGIARKAMLEALRHVPNDRRAYLEEAITNIDDIDPSPIISIEDSRKPRFRDESPYSAW
jgi:DNA modification methylase